MDTGSMNISMGSRDIAAPTALDQLDTELDRLSALIELLQTRLTYVSQDHSEASMMAVPVAAPRSPLMARVHRLQDRCQDLDNIINRLDI